MGKAIKTAYYETDYIKDYEIPESENFPKITFQYKPLNMIQAANLTDAVIEGKSVVGAADANLRMLGKQLVVWDITKVDGETLVDFTKLEELHRLDTSIVDTIIKVVRGEDPEAKADAEAISAELKNL